MSELMKCHKVFALALCIVVGCLALAYPVYGQLSLVSSTPSHGDTGVDTLLTLVLEFSAPLDTTVTFDEPEDFFLGIEIFPSDSAGEPEGDILLSPDSTTVTVEDLPLTPDTKFVVVLIGAQSAAGEPLDRPYAFTFTTGGSLPAGSVSGTVSYPGGDPEGTAVGLFLENPFAPGDDDEEDGGPDLEAGTVVPLSGNTYTVDYVPAGDYFVLGFKDANLDGNFQFPGDAFGGYDANSDYIIDKITIAEGQSLSNIDLTISIPTSITAREKFPTAQNVAQAQFPDAQLSIVSAYPVSPEGESESWMYGFYSSAGDSVFGVGHLGDLFFIFPFSEDSSDGPDMAYDIPLPTNWIDSDMAADTAEAYVGSDFRAAYPDAESHAFAGTFIFADMPYKVLGNRGQSGWSPSTSFVDELYLDFFRRTTAEDTVAAWGFFYYSEDYGMETGILLDAETGSPIFPGPGQPTSARDNLNAADQAAASWTGDAVLVIVGNIPNLTPEGLAEVWGFGYYSALKDSILSLFVVSGIVASEETESTGVVPSLDPLPPAWLDSPVVTPTAEAASGDFRNQHPDAWVAAVLSRGLRPSDPSLAVWRFMYYSEADTTGLYVFIDALTGDIVTGIDELAAPENMPRSFALEQNYPNPFNPETIIWYHLPQSDHVEIAIFNLLGQRVRVLVDEVKPAGSFEVPWDGTDEFGHQVASNVYFCRLKAGEFVQIKKMILMK